MSVGVRTADQATPELVSRFMINLQEPRTPYISPTRFAKKAGISIQTLAEMTGVHRNTVRQHPGSERLQAKLRDMVKAISGAIELTGDVDRAMYWFMNEPIPDYRHHTAAELIAQGQHEAVLAYLDDLKSGATG